MGQYCTPDTEPHRKELDTNVQSVKDYFLHGVISGHVRNYFMSTINEGSLTNHFANGTGGALAYSTASWKGLHFGVKGIFTYNLFSSELAGDENHDISPAKWEQELFDLTEPHNKDNLDRLEELYVAVDRKKIHAKFGKIDIDEGPLLQRRDGRMKPFVFKGLWTEWQPKETFRLYNGYVYGVSPRGMTEWYTIDEAVGILNNGRLDDTTTINYHQKASSKGLVINGVRARLAPSLVFSFWNYYLHHLHNTSWLQFDFRKEKFGLGLQYVTQFADQYQRKLSVQERYFDVDAPSHTISLMAGVIPNRKVEVAAAQLVTLGKGRFVFPKELTRDDFYTSISRSRMDGLGQALISTFRVRYYPIEKFGHDLRFELNAQYVNTNGCENYQSNKYSAPDYTQLNISSRFNLHKALEGLHINFLYVCRFSSPLPEAMSYEDQYYRTNLHHFNIVLDMVF